MIHDKIKWRCVQDKFGYCSGVPDWEEEPHIQCAGDGKPSVITGGKCKRDPKTCGKYQTLTQSLKVRDRRVKSHAKPN